MPSRPAPDASWAGTEVEREAGAPAVAGAAGAAGGGYLGQFDSYRVVACAAVVLQHSFLWTVAGGLVVPWAFVMLLHFSRTAFFFLTAFLLTYAQLTRPRTTLEFWRRRFTQLGVPYLAWTAIYWLFTLISGAAAWHQAGSVLWHDLVFGYYQLYFTVVLFQLYVVFPLLLRLLQAVRHHGLVMVASLLFALALSADLHWSGSFGSLGAATRWMAAHWPWSRDPLTYQEQFVAGILVALHLDQVWRFVARHHRRIIAGALAMLVVATAYYLVAVWTGSSTGRASDLYQPIAFLWFTAAVAGLESGTWWWYQRHRGRPRRLPALSAAQLAGLTGGIYLSHVLFLNLVRAALIHSGLASHLGWAGQVAVLYVVALSLAALFSAAVLRTPLRWVLGGPVRAEQRARLGTDDLAALPATPSGDGPTLVAAPARS